MSTIFVCTGTHYSGRSTGVCSIRPGRSRPPPCRPDHAVGKERRPLHSAECGRTKRRDAGGGRNKFVESHIASCALVPASGGVRGNKAGAADAGVVALGSCRGDALSACRTVATCAPPLVCQFFWLPEGSSVEVPVLGARGVPVPLVLLSFPPCCQGPCCTTKGKGLRGLALEPDRAGSRTNENDRYRPIGSVQRLELVVDHLWNAMPCQNNTPHAGNRMT